MGERHFSGFVDALAPNSLPTASLSLSKTGSAVRDAAHKA
jgi:hypothetical protein